MSFYLRLKHSYLRVEPDDERDRFDVLSFREERRARTPPLRLMAYAVVGAAATFGATFLALQPKNAATTEIARAPLPDPVTTGSVRTSTAGDPATTGAINDFAEPKRMLRPGWH